MATLMKTLRRAVGFVDCVLTGMLQTATALLFVGIVALVTYQVFSRYVLLRGTPWAEELPLFLNVWFSTLATALVLRYRGHIAIEFFVKLFPKPIARIVIKAGELAVLGFGIYLVVYGWDIAARSMPIRMAAVPWPLGFFYVSVPLGGATLSFYALGLLLGWLEERRLPD